MTALSENIRILLAEDNEGDVFLARLALHDHGLNCEVDVVSDGDAALTFVDRFEKDKSMNVVLFLLDLHLPKRDGIDVLRRLRAGDRGAHVPVLVLTSSDSPDDRRSAECFDDVHFFRKPSSLDEFLTLGTIAKDLIERQSSAQTAVVGAMA